MVDDLLERLAKLDSCAVSDALDFAGISGVALGLTELTSRRRVVGKAVTVKLGPDDGRRSKRHLGTAAVEAAGQQSLIVVDHDGRTDVAGWGGILTVAAVRRGVAGVIIDGACRDIDEARALDFPVYGRVGVPRTARGHVIERDWNVPVCIAGIEVSPGDLVIADSSGIAFVPSARAPELIAIAETIARKEAEMADAVRAGTPVSQVMAGEYENMLKGVQR
jgi:4-hydroxy-4-methyl-2-oxoglutarate aldolase